MGGEKITVRREMTQHLFIPLGLLSQIEIKENQLGNIESFEESCNILLTLAFSMVIKSIYLCILAVEQASRAYLKSASCFSWAWKD